MPLGKEHNGWNGYETWLVQIQIRQDKKSLDQWRAVALTTYERAEPEFDVDTKFDAAVRRLSETIKNWLENTAEIAQARDRKNILLWDLLNAAISEVDFYEIAQSFLNDLMENGQI